MLPTIVFFSTVSSLLFYLGVVQVIVEVLGACLQQLMTTSRLESVCAAGNIFLGQSEAPLLVAPLLPTATRSELHAIMTSGFSTVAGGVLAAYIGLGVPATHLIAASVISAPAALVLSKIACPQEEEKAARSRCPRALGMPPDRKSLEEPVESLEEPGESCARLTTCHGQEAQAQGELPSPSCSCTFACTRPLLRSKL